MVVGNNKSATTKKAGELLAILIAMRMRRYDKHRLIQHVQGFTRSHWMPPSGECLRHIAPAAVMVDKFIEITLNTKKTQLSSSNYGTFQLLVVYENFVPQNGPSTILSSLMQQAA